MPRIRTIKPEFWEDEVIGLLSHAARLLFVATWNLADDEGLLRWTAPYLKASVFMYDHDVTVDDVVRLMDELTCHGLVFPYHGGKAKQRLGWVVHFRKHQRVNRPQKSKLPPPSIQNAEVRRAYAKRDGWVCAICGVTIPDDPMADARIRPSVDHIEPLVDGGTDHPSNIQTTHASCNKSRGSNHIGHVPDQRILDAVQSAVSDSLSDSVNRSPQEGKGKGKEEETDTSKLAEPIVDLWEIWIEELGGKAPHPKLTEKRRQVLRLFFREHLRSEDDPLAVFRKVLQAVQRSDHHMGTRAYQMPESLFRNPERRDTWRQAARTNGKRAVGMDAMMSRLR